MKIDVQSIIKVYEINGEEVDIGKEKTISLHSHWNRNEFVVIKIGKVTYTVVKEDLEKAIQNACNT